MTASVPSPLAGALLGLLHQRPMSGYDLRKLFATSPLGHYSDSPGSIYPALKRLAAAKLVRTTLGEGRTRRPRELFHPTARGTRALKEWLRVTPDRAAIRRVDWLLIRFVFIPHILGLAAARAFLAAMERELAAHLEELEAYLAATASDMPLAGRLGLRNGIAVVHTHLTWCRDARRALSATKEHS